MLWTIVVILVVLWLLGLLGNVGGGLVHLLLVIALIVIVVNLLQGRRPLYNGPVKSDTLNEQNRVEYESCENIILTRSKPKWYSNC